MQEKAPKLVMFCPCHRAPPHALAELREWAMRPQAPAVIALGRAFGHLKELWKA